MICRKFEGDSGGIDEVVDVVAADEVVDDDDDVACDEVTIGMMEMLMRYSR